MDRPPVTHRLALPEELGQDDAPEASTCWSCERPWHSGPCGAPGEAEPARRVDHPPASPKYSVNDPNVRKTFPLRLSDMEREEGKRAAARMPLGSASLYTFSRKPWTEADWWRRVGLDWANVVNALPAGEEGELPSRVVRALQERIAQGPRLPAGVELEATPAMRAGTAELSQCAQCGLLVCATSKSRPLKACPECGGLTWWDQTLPVGPFKAPRRSTKRRGQP